MSLLDKLKHHFTVHTPDGKTKTYTTVTSLDGQPVQILAADEARYYQDQAKEVAKRRQREDEEQARKQAENIVTGTIRHDH